MFTRLVILLELLASATLVSVTLVSVTSGTAFGADAGAPLLYKPSPRYGSIDYTGAVTTDAGHPDGRAQGANAATLTARDQGSGEVLLEWQPQAGAGGYRIERAATGIPPRDH